MNGFRCVAAFVLIQLIPWGTKAIVAQDSELPRPNILWLVQEDLSPWLGCYGHDVQQGFTPNIDAMAERGVRFSRAYVPSPVCSTCRSAIIVGANQIRFGAHEHRSRRGEASLPLPNGIKGIPEWLSEAGYFCFNVGKTDYNFEHDDFYEPVPKSLSKRPWKACPEGKPFFGQIQLKGGKLNTSRFTPKTDRSQVTIPADYPQNDLYREIVAEHYDSARMDDRNIGEILKQLREDGLFDTTIVVYFSDHGANNLVRHKQQPTEGGSHVPFTISGPDPWVPAPSVRDDLVSMLDLTATTLAWAGIPAPGYLEGQDLFGVKVVPREFVATARDRCDQTIERIRSIRTSRYRYTRNYFLDRVLLQPQYRDSREFVKQLRQSYADGTLDARLAKIYFGERPAEELYDVVDDPAQMQNLAGDPNYAGELLRHRKLLDDWIAKGDLGAEEEPPIELKMADRKKWGRGVNSEYEAIRTDSDGDGLSDDWEILNGRDSADGRLNFQFDCGGWQTEGWESEGELGNIAGSQGFLDFELSTGTGDLIRDGLDVAMAESFKPIVIRMKSTRPLKLQLYLNDQLAQATEQPASDEFMQIPFEVDPSQFKLPDGRINTIRVKLESEAGAFVVIDSIMQ
jgi:N-sulfoglucosamine sulfohydrolase